MFLRRRKAKNLTTIMASWNNAEGRCAYDYLPCDNAPVRWVVWQDGARHGEGGFCMTHTVALATSRTCTYIGRVFP